MGFPLFVIRAAACLWGCLVLRGAAARLRRETMGFPLFVIPLRLQVGEGRLRRETVEGFPLFV